MEAKAGSRHVHSTVNSSTVGQESWIHQNKDEIKTFPSPLPPPTEGKNALLDTWLYKN